MLETLWAEKLASNNQKNISCVSSLAVTCARSQAYVDVYRELPLSYVSYKLVTVDKPLKSEL